MLFRLLNHLRAPEGDAGGGGAPAGAPPPPAPPGANGSGSSTVSRDELTQTLQGFKDGFFADLRRAGLLGGGNRGERPEGEQPPKPKKGEGGQPSGDDRHRERMRERAFDRAIGGLNLSDGAIARMERAFRDESPEDVAGWVKTYLEDFGVKPGSNGGSSPPAATPPTPPTPGGGGERPPPVTGVVAPSGLTAGEIRDPYGMTEDDVKVLVRQHGMHGAGKKIMEALRKAPPKKLLVRRR